MDLYLAAISIVVSVISVIIWIVRLEGKVKMNQQLGEQVIERLERIERLLDSVVKFNGSR